MGKRIIKRIIKGMTKLQDTPSTEKGIDTFLGNFVEAANEAQTFAICALCAKSSRDGAFLTCEHKTPCLLKHTTLTGKELVRHQLFKPKEQENTSLRLTRYDREVMRSSCPQCVLKGTEACEVCGVVRSRHGGDTITRPTHFVSDCL